MTKFIQKIYLSKVRRICKKNKIQYITLKEIGSSDNLTRMIIFCSMDEYDKIFENNINIKRCNNVYFNISEGSLQFELY